MKKSYANGPLPVSRWKTEKLKWRTIPLVANINLTNNPGVGNTIHTM